MTRYLLFLMLWLPPLGLDAATFEIQAQVDKARVELGEPLQLTVLVRERGQHAFPPQPQFNAFEDFDVRMAEPRSMLHRFNGVFSAEYVWLFELTPKRAGKFILAPIRAVAKDPLTGETSHSTQAITITVVRPQGTGLGLGLGKHKPSAVGMQAEPEPTPEPDPLAELKPDRGLPWGRIFSALGVLLSLIGLLIWLWWRKPWRRPAEVVPRDPGQYALEKLEQARHRARPEEEDAFMRELAAILRTYLRHRLALVQETTLAEAVGQALRRSPGLDKEPAQALRLRLELLLYGNSPAEAVDVEQGYARTRALIVGLEKQVAEEAARALQPDKPRRKRRGK